MKIPKKLPVMIFSVLLMTACRKELKQNGPADPSTDQIGTVKVPQNFFKAAPVPGVAGTNIPRNTIEWETDFDPNNGDDPIILGQQLNNPYTVANMQQAYLQLYGVTMTLSPTHSYVRFKPSDPEQLGLLLDNANLELQDHPMDYEVIQDGDYYQDSTLGPEMIGWLYSVVPTSYAPPAGMQYEVLAQLHLPDPDNLLLESMAESIAAGAIYSVVIKNGYRHITRTDEPSETLVVADRLPTPCEIDPCAPGCPISDACSGGGGVGGGGGGFNPSIPRGTIRVQDIRTCAGTTPITNVPVRLARVVCKRWFKIATTYTNNLGVYTSPKRFNNKVKIIVKTENNHAKVSKIRGARFWQILFPVKKRIGVFDQGAMANANYLFTKPNPTNNHDRNLAYWVAATTHNSVLEYKEYATEFGVGQPPAKLKVLVSNWGSSQGGGAAPMWNKCHAISGELINLSPFVAFFVAGPWFVAGAALGALVNVVKSEIDVIVGYKALFDDYDCRLTSANLKEVAYHEFGHASHYAATSCEFWKTYRVRISNEIATFGTVPYGDGNEENAGIVAVGEMWGNHCGHVFTNRHYGDGGASGPLSSGGFTAYLQGVDWENVSGGLNAYLNALEHFDPNNGGNQDWIPKGVCYDLVDPAGELFPVVDNVNAFTTQQCFAALTDQVRDIARFRDELLLQNGNLQFNAVHALFLQYGY